MVRRPNVAASPTAGPARHVVDGHGELAAGDERALRRLLGPLAWAVLADLALDAEPDDAGAHTVTTSARRVAGHLGVGKDTATRALRRLTALGLLERRPQVTGPAGRFGAGSYELRGMPASVTEPRPRHQDTVRGAQLQAVDAGTDTEGVSAPPVAAEAAVPRRRGRAPGQAETGQLSLLDAAGGIDQGAKR